MNYRNILDKGLNILKKNSIFSADLDTQLLLSKSINKSREEILLNLDKELNQEEINKFLGFIIRRKKKEPISIILGKKFFWKYDFKVNNDVLTPRFETELLVEGVLNYYKDIKKINVLDIGVGSGCILISLLKENSKWRGTGVDLSKIALKMAKTNAKIQQVENRIKFINSDIDKFCGNKYDLIVSNPPYINKIGYNNLDLGVKGYEPKQALYGGLDGLRVIEKVINKSRFILKNNGLLVMEIGSGQHNNVSDILKYNGFYIKNIVKDYQKIKRCIISKKI